MFKKTIAIAVLTFLSSASVHSQDLFNAEDAVQYRQSIYQIFAAQAGVIGAMVKGDIAFDAAEIHKRATNIGKVAPMLSETYFSATREVQASNMQDSAWKNMVDFKNKGQAFSLALADLVTASSQPDFDLQTARKTAGAVFKSCKGCHEDYRSK